MYWSPATIDNFRKSLFRQTGGFKKMGLTARQPELDCKSLSPAMATLLRSPILKYSRGAKIKVTDELDSPSSFSDRHWSIKNQKKQGHSPSMSHPQKKESSRGKKEEQDSPEEEEEEGIGHRSSRSLNVGISEDYLRLKNRTLSSGENIVRARLENCKTVRAGGVSHIGQLGGLEEKKRTKQEGVSKVSVINAELVLSSRKKYASSKEPGIRGEQLLRIENVCDLISEAQQNNYQRFLHGIQKNPGSWEARAVKHSAIRMIHRHQHMVKLKEEVDRFLEERSRKKQI